MNRMRMVLAGTGFSAAAGFALDRAALLSRATAAALELFHAVNLSGLSRFAPAGSGDSQRTETARNR
jgi:hypothetical protein